MDKKYSGTQHHLLSHVGPTGVYLYIIAIILPVPGWLPIVLLATASIVTALYGSNTSDPAIPRLAIRLVVFFIVVTIISIITSTAFEHSLKLSVSLLPALLIFYLITESFTSIKNLDRLFLCCTIAALLIAIGSLWVARDYGYPISLNPPMDFNRLVRWTPILVVKNDLTILSLLAPFSAVLLCRKPLSLTGGLAAISILISLVTTILFQSRGATLTMTISLIGVALMLRSRPIMISIAAMALFAIGLDAWQEFPIAQRFLNDLNNPWRWNRAYSWYMAWSLFESSPWLGHGLHTYSLNSDSPWPHNLFLEALSEQGVLGVLSLGALIGYVIVVTCSALKINQQNVRLVSAGVFGSVIGFTFSSLFELSYVREWVNLFLFLLVGLAVNLARHIQANQNNK
ncbi:MAG: O-antigen ligase family protein [bacterium]